MSFLASGVWQLANAAAHAIKEARRRRENKGFGELCDFILYSWVAWIVSFLQRKSQHNPKWNLQMLRSGVPLDQIGLVLRHRSIDMSAYYAKVDVALLRGVAQPWPGARS